jgi:hypothetical protein
MVIRPEQMEALSASSYGAFEAKVAAHLNLCFPTECASLGQEQVRGTIRHGLERARGYGITSSREVCLYIDVMIVFGPEFDKNPELSWAAEILQGTQWRDSCAKVEALFRKAKEEFRGRQRPVP